MIYKDSCTHSNADDEKNYTSRVCIYHDTNTPPHLLLLSIVWFIGPCKMLLRSPWFHWRRGDYKFNILVHLWAECTGNAGYIVWYANGLVLLSLILVMFTLAITVTSQWPRWRLKSPASGLFTQSFVQVEIKENIKAPRHWPLWGNSPWPVNSPHKGPVTRFHLMTSSCSGKIFAHKIFS